MTLWGVYAELRPDEVREVLGAAPAAYVPWGAVEWHGPHLPLGLDGLVADALCRRAAARSGGVVLPVTWWAVTTLPHWSSLATPTELVVELWRSVFRSVAQTGCQVIAVVTGHYAQAHDYLLMAAAERGMEETGALILAAPGLAVLGDEQRLDHAAQWETSCLLAIRPDLVRLDRLDAAAGAEAADLAPLGVLGADPRIGATPAQGEAVLNQAADAWARWVTTLLERPTRGGILEFYAQRRTALQPYVDEYYDGDWERAIQAWWQRRLRRARDGAKVMGDR